VNKFGIYGFSSFVVILIILITTHDGFVSDVFGSTENSFDEIVESTKDRVDQAKQEAEDSAEDEREEVDDEVRDKDNEVNEDENSSEGDTDNGDGIGNVISAANLNLDFDIEDKLNEIKGLDAETSGDLSDYFTVIEITDHGQIERLLERGNDFQFPGGVDLP
jgi:hypothetical protein